MKGRVAADKQVQPDRSGCECLPRIAVPRLAAYLRARCSYAKMDLLVEIYPRRHTGSVVLCLDDRSGFLGSTFCTVLATYAAMWYTTPV